MAVRDGHDGAALSALQSEKDAQHQKRFRLKQPRFLMKDVNVALLRSLMAAAIFL